MARDIMRYTCRLESSAFLHTLSFSSQFGRVSHARGRFDARFGHRVRPIHAHRCREGGSVYATPSRAVRISRTKSCITNWATPAQIMEVLFDERGNSFISFFQQSARWTVPSRAHRRASSRIKRDYGHSFHLIVNSYVLTTRVRLRARACVCGHIAVPVWLHARWRQFANRDVILSRCQPTERIRSARAMLRREILPATNASMDIADAIRSVFIIVRSCSIYCLRV